jgi:hypothetical protein
MHQKLFCLLVLSFSIAGAGYAQGKYVYTIQADSVKITNCDSAELILENHTQGVPGFLFNSGNGRTIFKHAVQQINDSLYLIGADTLTVAPSSGFWSLYGNYGTNPSSQFIGTTDCSPLTFRTCSAEQMRLFSSGNFGINTGNNDNGYKLQVNGGLFSNGAANVVGNVAFAQGFDVGGLGYGSGIRLDQSGYTSFMFEGPTQGWATDMFTFTTAYGNVPKAMYNVSGSVVKIQGGFNSANVEGLSGNVLYINPTYTVTGASWPMILRGIYYNPVIDSLQPGGRHIAIETVSGDVVLGSTSGNVGVGTNSPTAQLHTTGSVRFAGLTSDSTQTNVIVSDANGNLYLRSVSSLAANDIIRSSLAVNGSIKAKRLTLSPSDWPDYVFDSSYWLPALPEVENYIRQQHHLPGIASATEVRKDGVDVGDNQAVLLRKIEELTLYTIGQNKRLDVQEQTMQTQKEQIKSLETELETLKQMIGKISK